MSSKLSEAEAFVCEQLAAGPKSFREIEAAAARISTRTLQAAGQRLKVARTRAGEGGAWIWSLPPAPAAEPSPAAEPEVIEGELVAVEAVTAPPLILSESPSGPPDINLLINAAAEGGMEFPLEVTIRSDDRQVHRRIYTAPEMYSISLNRFTPTGAENYIAVMRLRRWNQDETSYKPFPPALVWDHGKLLWDEGRVPKPGFWRGDSNFRRRRSNT